MLLTIFRPLFARCRRGSHAFLFCATPFRQPSRAVNEIWARFPFSKVCEKTKMWHDLTFRCKPKTPCIRFSRPVAIIHAIFLHYWLLMIKCHSTNHHSYRQMSCSQCMGNLKVEEKVSAFCQTQVHLFYPTFKHFMRLHVFRLTQDLATDIASKVHYVSKTMWW